MCIRDSPTSCTPSLSCSSLRRQSSEIRAVCASKRSYGSARGATSDGRPYRDHVIPDEQPVRFRSQVGVLTTAYRRGPEVRFGEVTWTCSRQVVEVAIIGLLPGCRPAFTNVSALRQSWQPIAGRSPY